MSIFGMLMLNINKPKEYGVRQEYGVFDVL
jgi:hypothetical protein